MNAIPGGPGDPRAGQNLVNNEEKLRDDYNKTIAPYVAAREGYQKVVQAAKGATRADDIALVFGYMKTLDPNSTVREGEQAQVANSGTIPQTITNMYNKLITGSGALLPAQRAQFAQSAGQQFEVYQRTYDQATQRYGQMAQSYGFDPHRIVQQFPGIEPYHAPASAEQQAQGSGYSPDQAHTLMRFQGSRAPQGSEGNPFVPLNEGQYNKLPSGSWYVFTDGSVQRKP